MLDGKIAEVDRAIGRRAKEDETTRRLMTIPGVDVRPCRYHSLVDCEHLPRLNAPMSKRQSMPQGRQNLYQRQRDLIAKIGHQRSIMSQNEVRFAAGRVALQLAQLLPLDDIAGRFHRPRIIVGCEAQ
jgi:hypothetical protein